jgi:hypothetical protein
MAKKEPKQMVRCFDCKEAKLLQWGNNPVISMCKYRLYKDVANTPRRCDYYSKRPGNPIITKQTH